MSLPFHFFKIIEETGRMENTKLFSVQQKAAFSSIGIDINIIIDLKYERNLNKFADHIRGFSTHRRGNQILIELTVNLKRAGNFVNAKQINP